MSDTNMKRIHKVTIQHMPDTDPDTSYFGDYADTATSEYSIDRKHALDCPHNLGTYEEHDPDDHECGYMGNDSWSCGHVDGLDCCNGGDWTSRGFQYFNPSFNYVDEQGALLKENTPEEVRQYVRQDYERMEALNRGSWQYIGIRAEATVRLTKDGPIQRVSSGGCWGIEDDYGVSHDDIEQVELAALRTELHALGFSQRAISAAFKNVEQ